MSLQDVQEKRKTSRVMFFFILGVIVVFSLVLFSVLAYYLYLNSAGWFKLSGNETSTSLIKETTTSIPTTTSTVKPSEFVKSIKNLYADLTGGRECGTDKNCFDEAASSCKKATFTFDTGRVVQNRTVLGKEGDKCKVYYKITEIKDEKITPKEWLGLDMTCTLKSEDIAKDILTVPDLNCTGILWDKLKPYIKK